MKDKLHDLKLVLVYIYEYIVEGKKHSVVLKPIDAANGVILEETFDGSGIMRGRSVSGGLVHIPIEGITNHFQTWWRKQTDEGGQGHRSWWLDDEVAGNHAYSDLDDESKWDENGCHKEIEGRETLPDDAKSSRIIRGDGDRNWWDSDD